METVEQVNEDFNVKKPKKKGLIIGGIIVAVAVIVAFALVYFLILTNPKFIFSKTIDKVFAVNSESYDSIKLNTKMKASVELEDTTYQEQLAEIEKYVIKSGVQMDAESKQEIVDLGLEYDNEAVLGAQVYYNDGDMYAYLEGLFEKYIQIDIDEETKKQLDEIFEVVTSEEELKSTEKAIEIVKDELKVQIKEEGKFEKEKATIDVGDDEVKATKSTVTLTEKQLWKLAENMLVNLADNEEFLDCFEDETIDEDLKELAKLMAENETDGKSNVKISIYTKGLLNKLVAVDMQVYVESEATTITLLVGKEEKDTYSYSVSGKMSGAKIDLVKGKVEIEKDKDSKKEQSGKATITAEVFQTGSGKLEIDYSAEFNQGIDKIDTSNSVNINDLTETDIQSIMTKLIERPMIGELIESISTTQNQNNITSEITEKSTTQTNTVTSQNEVKEYGYSVTYSVPSGFVYDNEITHDYSKYYDFEEGDSEITVNTTLGWYTDDEYKENNIEWDYDYYKNDATNYYKNATLGELKTIKVADREFKYQILSYDSNSEYYEEKYQKAYVWTRINDKYIFTVEFDSTNKEITEDIIKGFLNITVKESN